MLVTLAQVRGAWGLSISDLAIWFIVVVGILAIAFIAVRAMGVTIPDWVIKIGWVIAVVFLAVLAIRLLAGM